MIQSFLSIRGYRFQDSCRCRNWWRLKSHIKWRSATDPLFASRFTIHGFSSIWKSHSPPGPALDGPENCTFIHPMTLCYPPCRIPWFEKDTPGVSFQFLNLSVSSPNQEALEQPHLVYNKTCKTSHIFAEKGPSHSSAESRPVLEELQWLPF